MEKMAKIAKENKLNKEATLESISDSNFLPFDNSFNIGSYNTNFKRDKNQDYRELTNNCQ